MKDKQLEALKFSIREKELKIQSQLASMVVLNRKMWIALYLIANFIGGFIGSVLYYTVKYWNM